VKQQRPFPFCENKIAEIIPALYPKRKEEEGLQCFCTRFYQQRGDAI
jgi:hypothetical protein